MRNLWGMTGRGVHFAHECGCVRLCFSFLSTVHVSAIMSCPSRVSVQTGGGSQRVGVCGEVVVHPRGPECVGASSATGSGRWSRGARCMATWSVGSA